MKTLLLILILGSISFSACINLTSNELKTSPDMILNQGNCIFITDWNRTIQAKNYMTNDIINISPSEPFHDIFLNRTYYANTISETINLTQGTSKTYPNFNFTVNCLTKKYNVDLNLDYNGLYYNQEPNISIHCPNIKTYNITKFLDYGETYNLKDSNITITAPSWPLINETITLNPGDSKIYQKYGLIINTISKINITKNLDFDECFTNLAYGINLCAPKKINKDITLDEKTNFSNSSMGLNIKCTVSPDTMSNFCKNYNETRVPDRWTYVNTSIQCSTPLIQTCADNVTQFCSVNELFSQNGFLNCVNRNVAEAKNTYNQTKEENIKLKLQIDSMINETKTKKDAQDAAIAGTYEFFELGILFFGSVILGVAALWKFYIETKKAGETAP